MIRTTLGLLVSVAAVASFAAPPARLRLKSVKHTTSPELIRLTVETTGEPKYRAETLADPDRLLFDFLNTSPDDGKPGIRTISVRDSRLRQIRIAETKPGRTRVVLDLREKLDYRIARDSRPGKLIIELRSPGRARVEPIAVATTAKLQRPAPASEKVSAEPVGPPVRPESRTKREKTAAEKLADETASAPEPEREAAPASNADREQTAAEKLAQEEPGAAGKTSAAKAKTPWARAEREKAATEKPAEEEPPAALEPERVAARAETRTSREKTAAEKLANEKAPSEEPRGEGKSGAAEDKSSRSRTATESRPSSPALPARGSNSMIRALGLKMGRVVIDPGHGGHDQGTSSKSGLLEKELVLDVSKRLGALIEERLGVEVIYTRTDDTFIPLEARTELANQKRADLFLSIHANSSPYRGAAGVETYYLNLTQSRQALEIAARENAASSRSVHELTGIIREITTNDKILESRDFAQKMQTALFPVSARYNPSAHNRGAKKAPFVVLLGAAMPSVLTEIGFLSNPREEALLKKPEHRQRIAEALFAGVKRYAESLSHFQIATKD